MDRWTDLFDISFALVDYTQLVKMILFGAMGKDCNRTRIQSERNRLREIQRSIKYVSNDDKGGDVIGNKVRRGSFFVELFPSFIPAGQFYGRCRDF